MLSKKLVDFFAHQSGIQDVAVAEREVVLTYALKLLFGSPIAEHFAFKGGTCIRKLWLGPTGRFSMDLDFTARKDLDPESAILELMEVFNSEFYGITFQIENNWRVTQDGLSFTTQPSYRHEWNDDGGFDLQVSLREKPTLDVLQRPQIDQAYFKDLEFVPPDIASLNEHEILAEKIRAANQRAKVRDLHDLFVYSTKVFDRDLVRRLAVIKLWQARDIFDPDKFFARIQQKDKYDWNDLQRLVRGTTRLDAGQIIAQTVSGYQFLGQLTGEEIDLAADAKAHRRINLREELSASCNRKLTSGAF
ncbi:MAG: nucleotidyl transferase AbiEii/AbiGii toxin family protein [Planctomycetes bacterium]|nr:nucleotidyl transferase AbiEii/AbiGii toxin family protein [Planctomycetota bacterium]